MKNLVYILLLYITLSCQWVMGQDTVLVSHQGKSYLLFDDPVSLVDVGNPAWYEAHIEGSTVMVVARNDSLPPTPIYVQVGEKPFTGMLAYHPSPAPFYDFRQGTSWEESKVTSQAAERLKSMQARKDLNFAQKKEGGVTFRLVGILHDLSATYLKFKISNQSSVIYQTDFIGFERKQRYRKGFFAKEKEATFPVQPLASQAMKPILPYSEGYLYYALPLWALDAKEQIRATLREKTGSRSLTLKIHARFIRRADLF
uniref:DUF4138 domain-containing protein n=1 Tax=Roseihalotalea indica TaxID=2867963 RepID=A0AA49GRR6_9BACT|nr:hypothetical protein K4G66_08310 [Tunicatimonas sp. TK19036]